MEQTPKLPELPIPHCENCGKIEALCVCEALTPLSSRLHVLILQHPQEPDQDLGTAKISHLCLPNSTLKVGLSWPNLNKALGRETTSSRWAVLHLGSGVKGDKGDATTPGIHFVDKQGALVSPQPGRNDLEGIVVLDGTWSQAKTLWWRNAWMLKLKRAVLVPSRPSLYQELRKEPRRECLSTLESVAESLEALGESPQIGETLRAVFSKLLEKRRALPRNARPKPNANAKRRHYRPRRKRK